MDNDGYISNGELFQVLKMMVGNNLKETQLQQIVDKTVINADKDGDGKISFSEFCAVSGLFLPLALCNLEPNEDSVHDSLYRAIQGARQYTCTHDGIILVTE